MLLEGIFAAITTPFYSDERIYYRKLEANVARYSRNLLAGMVVLGSTGEAPLVDDAEAREILQVAARAAAPEKVLIAGVGRESVKATVELAMAAAEFRYDAILVRAPSYFARQLSSAAILHYYRSIADRSPLPVIIYNIPQCVPYEIPIDVVAELASHPNIIGIKDSSGNVERIGVLVAATSDAPRRTVPVTQVFEAVTIRMLEHAAEPEQSFVSVGALTGGAPALNTAVAAPAAATKTRSREVGFQVLCGSGSTVLESLEAGATGAILGCAAFAPQACQEIYLAWKDHDLVLAREKQDRILKASRRVVAELGIAGVKHACDFNGYYGGRTRAPLLGLTAEAKAEIEQILAEVRN
ncbi:MAG: dihydrodipicolinate synthase family protein [Terracidiphilus sp.]